jgi:hypothetical protein
MTQERYDKSVQLNGHVTINTGREDFKAWLSKPGLPRAPPKPTNKREQMRTFRILAATVAVLSCTQGSYGLAEDRIGPDKDHDQPTHAQPDWPHGMVKLLQHDSRVYSIWVNGNENFYFKSTPDEIGELIKLFSETRLRDHVVTIKKGGKPEVKPFDVPQPVPYNVNFHHLDGIALHVTREGGEAKTFDPTLTIYVDPDDDVALLKQIEMPNNIILKSEIPGWPARESKVAPDRKLWHAEVRFENGKPAADFEGHVSTSVTLWEKDEEHPIGLGGVGHKGTFNAAFSEQEVADLKSGQAWLTMTVGNYLTKPAKDDPKLTVGNLVLKPADARPVVVSQPGYFYGRILFEDGSPAILDPEPWPGGQLSLDFPYTGPTALDEAGYFKVYFTPEQFEEVKARKARKNVYVPSFEKKGNSTGLHAYPAHDLSLDKEKAGELRIPKPGPKKKEK